MNITLDGFMAGPDSELDWHFNFWNEEMATCASEQLNNADTILLGRVTYNAMAKFWPSKVRDRSFPREDIAFAEMMNSYHKVVFSKTLQRTEWNNSSLAQQHIKKEILKLKRQPGKDMIIYGSGSIVSALRKWNLIDEYALWVHPVILGKGRSLFKGSSDNHKLKLVYIKGFSSGVILLDYKADIPYPFHQPNNF